MQRSRLREHRRWESGKHSVHRELGSFQMGYGRELMSPEVRRSCGTWIGDGLAPFRRLPDVHMPQNCGRNPGECLPVCHPYAANSTNKPKQGPLDPIHLTAMCMGLTFRPTRQAMYYNVILRRVIKMGGTCCTYGGRERCAQGFGGET